MHEVSVQPHTHTYTHIHTYTRTHKHTHTNITYIPAYQFPTELMPMMTAPIKWPHARRLTIQWMQGNLLLNVAGDTDVLALLGVLWMNAWSSGQNVWRKLSKCSMERYIHAIYLTWPKKHHWNMPNCKHACTHCIYIWYIICKLGQSCTCTILSAQFIAIVKCCAFIIFSSFAQLVSAGC